MELPLPPGRTPPKRSLTRIPITQDSMVEAAIRVLDAEGLAAVSMRRVAQELDTGAASLYAHVANKKELLDLVFDRIVGEVELPDPADPQHWREQVREIGVRIHATLSAHADVARVALANIPLGPNALRLSERMLAILLAGGVDPQNAGWFLDRVSLYICADADARTGGGQDDRFLFGLDLLLDGLAARVRP